jgi:copper(I)-binding protein
MGLADQLDEGDQVSVQLEFSEHDPIVVPVRIEQR